MVLAEEIEGHQEQALPEGWVWTTLEAVADVIDPQPSHRTPPEVKNGVPYVGMGDINRNGKINFGGTRKVSELVLKEHQTRYQLKKGDFIFGKIGTLGKPVKLTSPFDYTLSANVVLIQPKAEFIDPAFALAYMSSSTIEQLLLKESRATTQAAFGIQKLRLVSIPLAPFSEQQRIVAEIEKQFTRLDVGIASLKRARANLKRYKASVLKAACEGKLVPQDSSDEPASQLLQRILTERKAKWAEDLRAKGKDPTKVKYEEPAPLNTEDLPELPQGWCWATIDQLIVMLQYGTSVKADAKKENGVAILRMGNIKDGQLEFTNLKYIDPQKEDTSKYLLFSGDILINRTNSPELVGKAGLFRAEGKFIFASYLIRLRTEFTAALPQYLVSVINSEVGRRHVVKVKHQVAGQANINSKDICTMPIPLPPLTEQLRVMEEVERKLSVMQKLELLIQANLKRAERLRQSILKQAFEGKLVPQDPTDEPASVLLERIRAERQAQEKPTKDKQLPKRARGKEAGQLRLPL